MPALTPLEQLNPARFETPNILKKLASSSRKLAELKGIAASIPNQSILINTLALQEAKDSSEIENIVTTHDELFKNDVLPESFANPAAKEVLRYRQALRVGFEQVRGSGLLTCNHIIEIQGELERNNAGFRKLPGTALKDGAGQTIYTPPQDPAEIVALMRDLERFINEAGLFDADPLIKMALIHHQFESIHPFYDGNGRTGRIVNVLYLVKEGLLDIPVLCKPAVSPRTPGAARGQVTSAYATGSVRSSRSTRPGMSATRSGGNGCRPPRPQARRASGRCSNSRSRTPCGWSD